MKINYHTGQRYDYLRNLLLDRGQLVDTGHWQGVKDVPMTKTRELLNVTLEMPIPSRVDELQALVEPNLPWAEDHFQERVGGKPLNPGMQYKNWPYWRGGFRDGELFTHTYMERFWPKYARKNGYPSLGQMEPGGNHGIRYEMGDLLDVVELLAREPHTRQAYLPVWFPEDTGAVHGGRVPCTLGYQFLVREDRLHIVYGIRSCDLLRHFRDDVYMAARLCQWVRNELDQDNLETGVLTMHIASLHVFEGDKL